MTLKAFDIFTAAYFQELDLGNLVHKETVKGDVWILRIDFEI
jgi:hypothetical protein